MSAEVELVKKLVGSDLVVDAVEIPTRHKSKPLALDDIEDVLARFEEDADYAHFVIRVKRSSTQGLPKPSTEPQQPQVTIDAMLNETLELQERITENRAKKKEAQPAYDPEYLLQNASLLETNGEFELARNIYQTLVRKGLQIPQGLAGIARTYEKTGDYEKAIRSYQEAIAYSSNYAFYQALAALQIRIGNDEEASKTLLHGLGLPKLDDAQRFELHKSLGNCFTRQGDYAKAEHHYFKAYDLEPNSDALQVNVGSLALQKSNLDAAMKHFQKALELNATNDKAISGIGMVHLGKGELAKAQERFIASLRLNINNLGAIYNLVKCAYETRRFDEAAEILRTYIERNPVNTNILYTYAGVLFHQGRLGEAEAQASGILQANSTHAGAKELLDLIRAKAQAAAGSRPQQ